MHDQLQMQPRYKVEGAGQTHPSIHGAAIEAGDLTINKGYSLSDMSMIKRASKQLKRDFRMSRNTMFEEILAMSQPIESEPIRDLMENPVGKGAIDKKTLAEELLLALRRHLWETWDTYRPHIFLHTSGYDTRLISAILRNANIDKNIVYVCFEPEHEAFRKIADYMDWPKSKVFCLPETMDGYAEPMRFDEVGRHCSDAHRVSLHCWSWFVKQMAEKDTRIILGMYSDELYRCMGVGVAYFMAKYLHDTHWEWEGLDVYKPYLSFDWMSTLMGYEARKLNVRRPYDLKRMMVGMIDRELADLPTGPIASVKRFSAKAVSSMQRDFEGSWYYKTVLKQGELPDVMVKNDPPIWKEYFKAAICEYLINEGCRIK